MNDDAINGALFKPQWPRSWNGQSPLAGGATFHTLTPDQRVSQGQPRPAPEALLTMVSQVNLLKTLILWALGHSDAVKAFVTTGYNQHKRTTEDLNQPLSVQPWGTDSDKRRYYLIEGDDNTSFRIYREGNPAALYNRQWITVAGSIDEAKALAEKLARADGGQNARKLSKSIANNIVNFEEKEEKRKRREYRRQQKERFRRPEPGFSLYEGRTRGKRVKYTYSDDEDFMTDSTGNRRSTRNTRNHSPVDNGPVVTASGRQSRPPARLAVDNLSNGGASAAPSELGDAAMDGIVDIEMSEAPEVGPGGRPRRSAAVHHGTNGWTNPRKRRKDYISDDEDEDESEPDFGDDEEEEHVPQDESDDEEEFENAAVEDDDDDVAGDSPKSNDSRVVKFNIKVKFDKDGKAKKLQKGGDSSSAPTPSNVASSPEAADSPSDDSPNDVANHEPERTADEITAAPLKRGEPALVSAAGPPRASSAAPAADDTKPQPPASADVVATNGDAKPEAPSGVPAAEERKVDLAPRAPPTPGGGVPASLAFRSPEKPRAAVASTNRD